MKRLLSVLIVFAALAALGWVLWRGFKHRPGAGEEKPAAEAAEEKPEDFVVKLEKEKWEALGVEKDQPEKMELKPHRVAFGHVLDPTPIVTLDGDLAAAESALEGSQAENERTKKLLAAGESASRKAAETAEEQYRADQIKADGLRRRARLEWGSDFAALTPDKRRLFADQLVRGDSALIRVDLMPGDMLAEDPTSARVLILGREQQPIVTENIIPAASVDEKTQAQGFILRVDQPPFPLRPGMALTSWLATREPARTGFSLPASAILRHDGQVWIYVQAEEEQFVRKPVKLDTPLEDGKGWFIATDGGVQAEDLIITTGAQSLLSEELKAQGGGDAGD